MPAKHDCVICRGRGLITLPIYLPVTVATNHALLREPQSRSYPCPECVDAVPLERLAVVDFHGMASAHYESDPRFIEHIKTTAAHRLIDRMMRDNFITFERRKTDPTQMQFPLISTVCVVAPSHVATLEQRIAERQTEIANEVTAEAIRQINHFGSLYGHTAIAKSTATAAVNEALNTVLNHRKRTPL